MLSFLKSKLQTLESIISFSFSIFKLTTLAITFFYGNLIGQVQGDSVHIESTYAKKYTGTISKVDKEGYFIKTSYNREIFLSKSEIKTIKVVLELIEPDIDTKASTLFIDSNDVNTDDINALKEKPKVAFICNVTSLHVDVAIKCAKNKCHLFIEKPVSHNLKKISK